MNCSLRLFTAASYAALMLSSPLTTLKAQTPTSQTEAKKDIVDTAAGAKEFKTLVTAVKAADLVDVLKGKGPFTVFAPDDKAFKKVPKDQLEALLKDKKMLGGVLTYHVVPGKVMAADVMKLKSARTVQGKPVTIAVEKGKVKINTATVVKADIECSNGVIHVIDTVLMPPTE